MERLDPTSLARRTAPAFKILLFLLGPVTLAACNNGSRVHSRSEPAATAEHLAPTNGSAAACGTPESCGTGACSEANGCEARAVTTSTASATTGKVGKYGAPLGAVPAASLAAVLGTPERFADQPLQVEGHVRRACTAMGCWMELAESSAADAPGCRVIMKDHAFFVPTDAAGSDARVEGTLAVRHIEPGQVAHMEREGAAFPRKAADGSAEEVRFVATGVELWRGS